MSYADDYEEQSYLNPGLEHAIDEEYANFSGTGLHPNLHPNPSHIVSEGGWIQVQRGGITYPTPTTHKEKTMARDKATIQNEINSARLTIRSLEGLIHDREVELRQLGPAEPNQPRASVRVKFEARGKEYEFLLMRAPNGYWYTTGISSEHNVFVSWKRLREWLNSSDVYWYSEITPLVPQSEIQAPF